MARRPASRPPRRRPLPEPRALGDLPYAAELTEASAPPGPGALHEVAHWQGASFDDVDATEARFVECAFSEVSVTGGDWRRTRLTDVWVHGTRWVGTSLADGRWTDVEVGSGVLAGVELFGADLRHVTFHRCKLDSVNLRGATLTDVSFVDCTIHELDLGRATARELRFPGSTLERLRCAGVDWQDVDLAGARALDVADTLDALRGATISGPQAVELAPRLAQALGVSVAP